MMRSHGEGAAAVSVVAGSVPAESMLAGFAWAASALAGSVQPGSALAGSVRAGSALLGSVPAGVSASVSLGARVDVGAQVGARVGEQVGVPVGGQLGVRVGEQVGVQVGEQVGAGVLPASLAQPPTAPPAISSRRCGTDTPISNNGSTCANAETRSRSRSIGRQILQDAERLCFLVARAANPLEIRWTLARFVSQVADHVSPGDRGMRSWHFRELCLTTSWRKFHVLGLDL